MIELYLQQIMVMEREESCMVPLVKVLKKAGHAHLLSMHIVKVVKKGEPTFLATIESLGEDNGTMDSLQPIIEEVHEENKDMMPNELSKTQPPRCELDHMIELDLGANAHVHAFYRMDPP